jgi:hypothetical protein
MPVMSMMRCDEFEQSWASKKHRHHRFNGKRQIAINPQISLFK